MSNLRRYFQKGSAYFITSVTFNRQPILIDYVDIILNAKDKIIKGSSCDIIAYTVLPDHFHLLFSPNEQDFTKIIQRFKMSFAMSYLKVTNQKSGRVWQKRYWDHIIRDETDMNNHVDYIHYNSVKHGIVKSPFEWEHCSIGDYKDYYASDWGVNEIKLEGKFGE